MCGLSGVLSTYLTPGERETFRDLFTMSTLRGAHGCGVASIGREAGTRPVVATSKEPAAAFSYSQEFDTKFIKPNAAVLLGHARHATNNSSLLHPHKISGNFFGMHNGTMTKVAGRRLSANESDSLTLFQSIHDVGLKETIESSEGSYSLIWWDGDENRVHFLRNDKRPLYTAMYKGSPSTIFFSSEAEMLALALKHNTNASLAFHQTAVNMHYAVDVRKTGGITITALGEVAPKTAFPNTNLPWNDSKPAATTVPEQPITKPIMGAVAGVEKSNSEADESVETSRNSKAATMFKAGRRTNLFYQEFSDLLTEGCQHCGAQCTFVDYYDKRIHWVSEDRYVCDDCATTNPDAAEAAKYTRMH